MVVDTEKVKLMMKFKKKIHQQQLPDDELDLYEETKCKKEFVF